MNNQFNLNINFNMKNIDKTEIFKKMILEYLLNNIGDIKK
jgi:hypothetical protein